MLGNVPLPLSDCWLCGCPIDDVLEDPADPAPDCGLASGPYCADDVLDVTPFRDQLDSCPCCSGDLLDVAAYVD